jgi:hypothetical protein
MVAPYNYLIGGGGPIEAALGGLRIGASLAEMEATRAVQLANEQAKLEAVRQRDRNQQRFQQLINLPRQMTVAESAEAASLVNEQAGGIIRDAAKNLPEQQQFASAGRIGRLISAAQNAAQDNRYVPFFDSLMAQSIEAETDPAQKKALQDLQEFARISADPTKVANFGLAMMEAAGGKYSEIAKAIHERSKGAQGFRVLTSDEAKAEGLPTGNTYQRNTATGETKLLTAAGKSFEIVSPEQAKALNLPAGAYKREIGTGEISAIGSGGTNITLKTEGSIPEGYRAIRDSQGNLMSYEPVPGSPAAAKAQAEVAAQQARAEGKTQQAGIVSQDIQRLVAALDSEESLSGAARLDPRNYVTGIPGKAAEKLPGSARIAAQGFVDSIKASIGFDRLDQMRQESPTGGALGNITEQELRFLQATLGSIDLDSKPEVLRQNLRRLQTIYENIMRKAAEYPNAAKFGFSAAAQGQVGGATVQPAPGGAVMEPVVRPPAGAAPPARTPSPAGAAPPARGGTSLGNNFRLLED